MLEEEEFDLLCMRAEELPFVGGFRSGELLTLPKNALMREIVLDALQAKIDELRAVVPSYDEMWARYESNMHRLGLDPHELQQAA